MNQLSKLIFFTFIFSLAVNFSFGQESHELELKLDTNGKLIDPPTPEVRQLDTVSWIINDPNIIKFSIKRKGRGNIWRTIPERDQATQLELVVARFAKPFGGKWEYSIQWTGRDNQIRDHDPKIAVKPIIDLSNPVFLLAFLITLITSIVFYRRWQKAERLLKHRSQNK